MNKPFKYYFVSILLVFLTLVIFVDSSLKIPSKNSISESKFYPSEYEFVKRTFPFMDYEKNSYQKAYAQLNKMKMSSSLAKNTDLLKWEFVGPTNIGGRIVDIEFNPKNPDIVYAASATGGVFKSIDTGETWSPIFDNQPCLSIGDIGIDPNNPDIIFVGTGEANGGHNNFPGSGIYKSVDSGTNWKFIGLDSTVSISRIIVDPLNSNKIFVAAVGSYFAPNPERGVYLSEDGGDSWESSLFVSDSTGAIDLIINPNNPNIIYAAMWERVRRPVFNSNTHLYGSTSGIYKSIDGGKNWRKLGVENGLPDPNKNQIGRIGLTILISNPSALYALYNNGTEISGLFRSDDGGENWEQTTNQFPGSSNFSWYFGQVRVSPNNPNVVYVLDVPFLKSFDSGVTWDFSYGRSDQLHVDHHALAFNPNDPNYIISGNDGGINISKDGGKTWLPPAEIPITQFYEIGIDQTSPESFYGGTQDNNTVRTLTGNRDDWESIFGGDGFYVIVNPTNPDIIYAESQFGYLGKSTDGGNIFSIALNGINRDEPTNWSTPVVMDPNNSNILYYGTHTLYRTVNSAEYWVPISGKLTDHSEDRKIGTITTIAVAPTNSNTICVGTDDGYVWITNNNGTSWRKISDELPYRWVTRVVFDPKDENKIYVTFSGLRWADSNARVFRSNDMGNNWENISTGLPEAPINALAIDNNDSDIIYLGNDVGAFVSYNHGGSWEILAEDLPIVVVNDMKIHPTKNYLAIGTHGRGIYKVDLNKIVGESDKTIKLPNDFLLSQNYPNPFNSTTTIEYTLPIVETQNFVSLQLKVYDVLGREVSSIGNLKNLSGIHSIHFDAKYLPSGIYYYQLSYRNFTQTKKMVLLN